MTKTGLGFKPTTHRVPGGLLNTQTPEIRPVLRLKASPALTSSTRLLYLNRHICPHHLAHISFVCVFIASTVDQLSPSHSSLLPSLLPPPSHRPYLPLFSLSLFALHSPESTASARIRQLLHKSSSSAVVRPHTEDNTNQIPDLSAVCRVNNARCIC